MKRRKRPQYVVLEEYHGEPVGEEGSPEEKETAIGFNTRADKFVIDTQEGTIMRWLLRHPHFELQRAIARREGRGLKIIHVIGTLPIGCLLLKGNPRNTSSHARVLGQLPRAEKPPSEAVRRSLEGEKSAGRRGETYGTPEDGDGAIFSPQNRLDDMKEGEV